MMITLTDKEKAVFQRYLAQRSWHLNEQAFHANAVEERNQFISELACAIARRSGIPENNKVSLDTDKWEISEEAKPCSPPPG